MSFPEFVDTHVHFWDQHVPGLRYDWLAPGGDPEETAVLGEYGAIRSEKYLAEDFLRETQSVKPAAVVHVQAAVGSTDPVVESAWLAEARRRTGLPSVFIGDARLIDQDLDCVLDAHAQFEGFRGIRDLQLTRYLTEPGCRQGMSLLETRGLVLCDADAQHRLSETVAVIARHPGLTYCVDHTMMPMRRDPDYARQWGAALEQVARIPHAVVKVSGLGQTDHDWTPDSVRPWIHACLETFGANRVIFGTNWPVDRLYSSYRDIVEAYVDACSELSEQERHAVLAGNARRIFSIPEAGGEA